jgi:DnaD/phage-associated family protein
MNELVKKDDNSLVSNIETGQLVKSKNFLFTNLSQRMSFSQNVLFSLALLHNDIDEDGYATSTFTKKDVERYLDIVDFKKGRSTRVIEDIEQVGTNSIVMFDEQMVTDPKNGKLKGVLIFAQYTYNQGVYHFVFNTTKIKYKDQYITPILDILRRNEVNPVVYNLDIFAKLNASGQVLYEQILLATNAGKRELVFNLEGLRSLFGLVGASMQTFGNIKLKHLVPAVEKINKFAGVGVVYKPIKEGRKITGVKIYWTLEKVKIPATEAQIKLAHELYAELTLMNAKNVEALKLQDIERCTKNDAQTIIDTAIKAKKELVKKALEKDKEAVKLASIDESKEFDVLELPELETIENINEAKEEEVEEFSHLDLFFNRYPSMSIKNREAFIELSKTFDRDEALKVLELADEIKKAKKARSFNYTLKILREWADNGVKTVSQAESFYKVNYNDIQENSSTAKTKSSTKQTTSKSNVPKWSNPDYVNKLDPKIIDMLEEFHKSQGTFETPEAQAEIAQRRAEIEQGRANLEAQKQELLARLDKKRIDK